MKIIAWTALVAIIFGVVGFVAGFFGPMIFMPKSNQGPMIGFIWGPLGVVLGALNCCVIGIVKKRRSP